MAECPFVITTIPERKKPCLFWRKAETELVKIAQFNDPEAQEIFIRELNAWIAAIANEAVERVVNNEQRR